MRYLRYLIFQFCIRLLVFQLAVSIPFNVIAEDIRHAHEEQHELVLDINEEDLARSIIDLYTVAQEQGFTELPKPFVVCYAYIKDGYKLKKEHLVYALRSFVIWLKEKVEQGYFKEVSDESLEPGITRGGGCCCNTAKQLNQILNLLLNNVSNSSASCAGIGNPGDTPCQETIFGILGDPCITLSGQSIAQGIAQLETCCEATLTTLSTIASLTTLEQIAIELNNTITTLEAITIELQATVTTLQTSINGTFTALNACCNSTFSAIADLKSTVTADFQFTWTILGSLTNCCGGTFTALAAIQNSVNGTLTSIADLKNTMTNDFQFTWTILGSLTNCCAGTFSVLGNVGTVLGANSSISGTLLNILQNTNTLTNCCNGTFSVLGNVGTVLGANSSISGTLLNLIQDANGTLSVLGNPGTILGQGATISGTLLNILQNTNTLTNCCAGTFSVLGNVGTVLGANSSISGTLLNILNNTNTLTNCCAGTFSVLGNIGAVLGVGSSVSGTLLNLIQDANGTLSVLGNPGIILGQGATISGTLLSIYNIINTCSARYIHNSDVGTTGFTISTSGVYRLAENITFSPAAPATAITITTSNVLLDLQCFNITQGNVVQNVNGIKVSGASTLFNVTVKNGLVSQMSGTGIVTSNLTNFHLHDTLFEQLGLAGIDIEGTNNGVFIDHCDISLSCSAGNNLGAVASSLSCFALNSVTNGKISNCNIYNNQIVVSGDSVATLFGLNMSSCVSLKLENIASSGNNNAEYRAFNLTSCNDLILSNFSSQEDTAGPGELTSFSLTSCTGISVFNSSVQGTTSGANGFGFRFNATNNSLLQGCIIINNTGGNGYRGIFWNGTTFNTARNCLITANTSGGPTSAINISDSSNNLISWCTGSFNSSNADICQGLLIDNTANNNMIQDSDFSENNGDVDADSFGVNVVSGTNNLFTRVRAYNNGTTVGNQLFGVPAGSIVNLTSTTMNDPAGPWGSASIVP